MLYVIQYGAIFCAVAKNGASIGEPFKNKPDRIAKEENSFIVSFGLN
ncbi:hypothetical protein [Sphingobacterium siyangense]